MLSKVLFYKSMRLNLWYPDFPVLKTCGIKIPDAEDFLNVGLANF